ncbi:MAG: glycosyltransferase WbuB [Gammaproteobacteria bacterium]|nr:glycosyltransferase WbuB [Gammaproteobacteria bacterium]
MRSKLTILIYSVNYAPELTGIGKYNAEMCEWLVKQGHSVQVITAQPYYPDWKIFTGYKAWQYSKEMMNGVSVLRCPLWIPAKPSGLKRSLHLLSFAASSLIRLIGQRSFKPDIVLFIEPSIFTFPGALLASKLTGAKPVLHVQDFEVDMAFNLGLIRCKRLHALLLRYEAHVLKRCAMVSTITPTMRQKLLEKGLSEQKALLFPNWADTDNIKPLNHISPFRTELGISPDKIVALYSGNMGEKQGLEIILEAAKRVQGNPNIVFVMCGTGSFAPTLKQMAKTYGLEAIIWLPLQPLHKLNDLLNMADIHLLPQKPDVQDQVMPSKLLGMLASGRAILATAMPGTQLYQVVKQAGLVSMPGNVGAFADNIVTLASDINLRTNLGAEARAYAEQNFSKQAMLTRYEQELKQLIT